jgi:recombinational DNA repair protein RecR
MVITDPIKTQQVLPGIWHATYGDYDLGDPIGTGRTEAEAVADLKDSVDVCAECEQIKQQAVCEVITCKSCGQSH